MPVIRQANRVAELFAAHHAGQHLARDAGCENVQYRLGHLEDREADLP